MFYQGQYLTDLLALAALFFWPVVPLFWIPVHGFPRVFKRLGLFTYLMPAILLPPIFYLIFLNRGFLLSYRTDIPLLLRIGGAALLLAGTLLHIRTGILLSLRGLVGLPEISRKTKSRLVTEGAFSLVRHPTYLAHTLMFAGVFLISGVITTGIITVVDLIVVNAFVIPLEEKELSGRFKEEYEAYRKRVPRFFPRIGKK